MSQPARPGQPNPHVERSGTLIETDEEVRQAILTGLKGGQGSCFNSKRLRPTRRYPETLSRHKTTSILGCELSFVSYG